MTGVTGVVGLLGCILRARATGIGCDVDTSLFDVALHQLGYTAVWYLNEGDVSRRQPRGAHLSVAPVQTFRTADGWIFLMCMTDKFWESLVDRIGRPELKSDPRFSSQALRRQNRGALTEVIDDALSKRATGEWLKVLSGVLPVAPVLEIDQALDSAFVREAGMVRTVPHPDRPDLRVLASPLKIDGARPQQAAAPALGADNARILGTQEPDPAPALPRVAI
jgi:crotonobetainyl-CoA:carnitine CoA-transferase CaiB-like acyl-CoA transferase